MTNWRLWAPLLRLVKDEPCGNVAVAPVGRPELAESETELENPDPVGVTVTV